MKKDSDIRNFFKSSADKTQVMESKMKQVIDIPKEKVTITKEESIKRIEEDNDTKQKKGRKRKGADLDQEDHKDNFKKEDAFTKKKKVSNKKNKESKKMIENPIPLIKEEFKIKIDSKGRKIIQDDDEDNEEIYNTYNNQEKESKIENEIRKEAINTNTDDEMKNVTIDKHAHLDTFNNNKIIKPTNIIHKPEDNKKTLKPIDASSFFGSSRNSNSNLIREEIPKIIEEEEHKIEIILEENIIPMDVDNKNVIEKEEFDDFDIDAMDLDMIAKDMFTNEFQSNIKNEIKPVIKSENELSFGRQMEILEIKEQKKQIITSNSIMNNKYIKPNEEIKKLDDNKIFIENNLKPAKPDNLIANRFIQNVNTNIKNNITSSMTTSNIPSINNQNTSHNFSNKNAQTNTINNNTNNKSNTQSTSLLWTDRYHPKTVDEIIGNQAVVRKLIDWLNHWDDVVLYGNKRDIDFAANNNYSTRGKSKIENINARACIISGPPGIGKTTTVRLIAKILNYRTFELNASDQRNKHIISSTVGYLMDNKTISNMTITNKNLIIMDEIDGMGGNEDKGGIKALIDIIKKTKLPIVCICNDIQSQKLRNLLNYCYELKFSKPDKRLVIKRLLDICKIEKFNISPESLEYLCESVGHDIRQCLNFLEMRARSNNILHHHDMKSKYDSLYSKDSDLMISVFDSCKKMLTKNEFIKLRFSEKMDLFFIDFDLLPSLIYENYLSCHGNNRTHNDLRRVAESSEHISLGDVIEKKIKRTNEWSLLPNRGVHSCLGPAIFSGNYISYTKFPDLFGKFSKMRKIVRQLKEFKQIFNYNFQAIKEEIVPLVFAKITNYLIDLGKEGVEKVIDTLHILKMNVMLFKENLFDLQPNESILKKYEKLHSGIKSYLTKKLNEEFKTSIVKKKRKGDDENTTKFDQDGNIIEDVTPEDDEGADSELEVESNAGVVSRVSKNDTKKTKKAKK